MSHGLDPEAHLVMQWQWQPMPPLPRHEPLPPSRFRDDEAFLAAEPPIGEMAAFRFSFPQLAKQTPDLRFYRLIQIFNTPLLSLTTREAAHAGFAYWSGAFPTFRDDFRWMHLWFFKDRTDDDTVAVEYGFDGGLVIHSRKKSPSALAAKYAFIVARVASAVAATADSSDKVTS